MRNISVRVPWHDNGWDGTVCKNPTKNTSCLRLKNIFENKLDKNEEAICSKCVNNCYENIDYCIKEGGCFMSPKAIDTYEEHPYKKRKNDTTHQHFLPTKVTYPAYSLPARPFYWLMVDRNDKKEVKYKEYFNYYGVDYDSEIEEDVKSTIKFNASWIQDRENQSHIFKSFYNQIKKEKSLVFIYAKQVPFCEANKRILIGVGRVKKVIDAIPHNTNDENNTIQSMIWSTQIEHSIRDGFEDGFLIPYEEILEATRKDDNFNPDDIIVKVPDSAFEEFSYAAELVSYDSSIKILNDCKKAFDIINEKLNFKYSHVVKWIRDEIKQQWTYRGLYPGLGSMLKAIGMKKNAYNISEYILSLDGDTLIDKVNNAIDKSSISPYIKALKDFKIDWDYKVNSKKIKKELFVALCRIPLTIKQAEYIWNEENRGKTFEKVFDNDIIDNPYLIYEKTRLQEKYTRDSLYVPIESIDFSFIENKYLKDDNLEFYSLNDQRRLRAFVISILENQNEIGNTIVPYYLMIDLINKSNFIDDDEIKLQDILSREKFLLENNDDLMCGEMKNNNLNFISNKYFKLIRINDFDDEIKATITSRLNKVDKKINCNWKNIIDSILGNKNIDESEKKAREEKSIALESLANNRISVLTGGAGTGKTTVLKALCSIDEIRNDDVLLLAPTGKATIRLKESVNNDNIEAYNIAQFCFKHDAYNGKTMTYRINRQTCHYGTVIVDESSMLTTEMFGALMSIISSANRIILVGDKNQLPPIGSGRPFIDIISYLRSKEDEKNIFVNELITNRRQIGEKRLDLEFANLFTPDNNDKVDRFNNSDLIDNINNIEIVKYNDDSEFENKLMELLVKICGMDNIDDSNKFNEYFGITANEKGTLSFSKNYSVKDNVEKMQILSPVKNNIFGIRNINRLIHNRYRFNNQKDRYGDDSIVTGDKVINNTNNSKIEKYSYESRKSYEGYVANGEIGVVRRFVESFKPRYVKYCNIEFSTQENYSYGFKCGGSEEEGEFPLELAYALTIHKTQGSDFGTTILAINEPSRMLSRELLYTALTRQKDKIYILTNVDTPHLLEYTSGEFSETSQRWTDLLCEYDISNNIDTRPLVRPITRNNKKKYYENKMGYFTENNEEVRSKSELIIADKLKNNDIPYNYEEHVIFNGYEIKPDFTFHLKNGTTIYWEHCGLMGDYKYEKCWKWKEKLYKDNDISEDNQNLIVTKEGNGKILDTKEVDSYITKLKEMFNE